MFLSSFARLERWREPRANARSASSAKNETFRLRHDVARAQRAPRRVHVVVEPPCPSLLVELDAAFAGGDHARYLEFERLVAELEGVFAFGQLGLRLAVGEASAAAVVRATLTLGGGVAQAEFGAGREVRAVRRDVAHRRHGFRAAAREAAARRRPEL